MSKTDVVETEGVVVEVLRNANFKVQLSNGFIITAYLSGKLHLNNIRILCDLLLNRRATFLLLPGHLLIFLCC